MAIFRLFVVKRFVLSYEHRDTALAALSEISLAKLTVHGFTLCAIVETRAGNFQPWLKPPAIFPKLIGTFAAQTLAACYNADPNPAVWRRFGRLPGFTKCSQSAAKQMASTFVREITEFYEARE